jgi:histone arginine demethylase JMJD6
VKYDHRRTSGEIWRCKKGKRSDIKPSDWDKWGYALNDEVLRRPIVYDEQTVPIPRVKRKDITPEWFLENAMKPMQPYIVEGVTEGWPANERWCIEAMEERFRQVAFKVAKDDKGKKLRTKFKYYADYLRHQQDDSPLYLFETNMDDNGYIRPLREDFETPDLFPQDYFALVNEDARPPHRWFCIGPKRSGTTVHIDPLGTAAWNVVTHGCKHWVLMEPKEQKRVVKGRDLIKGGEDDEAIHYFDYILPRIKRAHPELRIYEGLQNPGEVIFVPGDWWHGVLNREDCVAVTENYCGPDNFDRVWERTRKEREKVAYLWLRNMRRYAPDLAARALEMNRRDKFRMRHERAPHEKLSDVSSSSSESSSDSSTDEAGDLTESGLQDVLGEGVHLGSRVWKTTPKEQSEKRKSAKAALVHDSQESKRRRTQ